MTESEVKTIEVALDCQLPNAYRKFLLQFPAELCTKNLLDYEDEDGKPVCISVSDRELRNNPEAIVALNRDDPENYQWSMKLHQWPDNFLIVGGTDSGGVYAIDRTDPDGPVYYADQSTSFAFDPATDGLDGYFEKVAESIDDWANRLIAHFRQSDAGR